MSIESLILLEDQWNWNIFGNKKKVNIQLTHVSQFQPLKSFVIIRIVAIKPI